MIPVPRTEKLLIQAVGEELIVYDEQRDTAHCLNPIATRVWYYCEGQNTIEDIAKLLEEDLNIPANGDVDIRGLVWLTLEELEHFHLIEGYQAQPTGTPKISRRKMIKKAALVGGFAIGSLFPLIQSIVAPTPVMACPDPEPCPTQPPSSTQPPTTTPPPITTLPPTTTPPPVTVGPIDGGGGGIGIGGGFTF